MSAELVILVPVVLLMLLLIAQFALWAHAMHIAQATASHALSATRVRGAAQVDGDIAARDVLAQLGGGPLRNTRVVISRGAEQSTVDVAGEVVTVLPFLVLPVEARAVGPTERYVAPSGGPG
ncbi:MAG TPA: TadE/TadG family type IV pilus assembly protein [Pseudonocardiaceae bacterium]|nr:TadE/TadG family type IV pilus assembly protein [Pseudonocardiaceae bacterium]